MRNGAIVIPRDGFSDKLHLTSTTGKIIVPLTADVTTANVQDNKMYVSLTSSSSIFSLSSLRYMMADPGDMMLRYCTSIVKNWE